MVSGIAVAKNATFVPIGGSVVDLVPGPVAFTGIPNDLRTAVHYQTVAAIQPLNEYIPTEFCAGVCRHAGVDGSAMLNAVRSCWLSSYNNIRANSSNTLELIHDAFQPLSYWDDWQQPPNHPGVAMDTHIYQVFSNAVSFTNILGAHTCASRVCFRNALWSPLNVDLDPVRPKQVPTRVEPEKLPP